MHIVRGKEIFIFKKLFPSHFLFVTYFSFKMRCISPDQVSLMNFGFTKNLLKKTAVELCQVTRGMNLSLSFWLLSLETHRLIFLKSAR